MANESSTWLRDTLAIAWLWISLKCCSFWKWFLPHLCSFWTLIKASVTLAATGVLFVLSLQNSGWLSDALGVTAAVMTDKPDPASGFTGVILRATIGLAIYVFADRVMLPKLDGATEIKQGNVAYALFRLGIAVIILGAMILV